MINAFHNNILSFRFALVLGLLGALAGCTTTPYKTGYDYDREALFGNYRTYAWISNNPMIAAGGSGMAGNPLWQKRIMEAVEFELTRKGYRLVTGAQADFVVAFTLGARDKVRVDSYPVQYRRGWWGPTYVGEQVNVRNYTEGTLAIDIFDRRGGRPVWHGWATGNVRENRDNAEREALIREVVASIFGKFPPP